MAAGYEEVEHKGGGRSRRWWERCDFPTNSQAASHQLKARFRTKAATKPIERLLATTFMLVTLLSACTDRHKSRTEQKHAIETRSNYAPDLDHFDPGEPMESPTLAPDVIALRILKLIDSVRGQQDLSARSVEHVTGIEVNVHADNPDRFGFWGGAAAGWDYGLTSLPEPGSSPVRQRLRFGFFPKQEQSNYAPVCKPSYQDYAHALVARGFRAEVARPYADEPVEFVQFKRGPVTVEFSNKAAPAGVPMIDCVSHIFIFTN